MKNTHTLILIVLAFTAILCGCSASDLTAPESDPIPTPEYGAEFNASPLNLFIPYVNVATLWYNVIGEPESVTIYKDGEEYTETQFQANEPGSWEFELHVDYTDTLITRSLTITASEEEIEPGTPIDGMLVIAPNNREAPYDATISLYAWGGTLSYSFEIIVGGEVYTEPTITFTANLPGDYEVIGTIIDADGMTVEFEGTITATAPGELPPLTLDATGFALDNTAYLEAHGSGGDGDYSYRWFYESIVFSTDRFTTYSDLSAGDHTFTVYVEDGTGNGSTFQDVTVTVQGDVYLPLDVEASVSLLIPEVPVAVFLEAHPSGGDGDYSYQWFYFDDFISSERFTSYYGLEAGGHEFTVIVTDGTGETATSMVEFEVVAEHDPIIPMTITPNGTPQDETEPVTASLWVDIDDGSGDFSIEWVYDSSIIATTATTEKDSLMAGNHTFSVTVTDNVTAQVESGDVTIRVESAPGSEIEEFETDTDLWVGPTQEHDTDVYSTTVYGRFYTQLRWKMDVLDADRGNVIFGIKYADGSWVFLTVPDVLPERPAYFWADAGELLIEEDLEVHIWFENEVHGDKCDGKDRLLKIRGSREVSDRNDKSGDTVIYLTPQNTPPEWLAEKLGL